MQIKDRVWGDYTINETFLIDLLQSKPVQRIKDIAQTGLIDYEGAEDRKFSRYDHSVGVMLCLRHLGASIEEQAAGLLHDVSHTAFSHTIDRAIGDVRKADYQDKQHEKIIRSSELPKIYEAHGFSIDDAISMKKFKLLECEAPLVCADRLDYTLRESAYWHNPGIVKEIVGGLEVKNRNIVFSDKERATKFVQEYSSLQDNYWGGTECMLRAEILAEVIKSGLREGIITEADFNENDAYVISLLEKSGIPSIKSKLKIIRLPRMQFRVTNKDDPESIALRCKFRYIDPNYINGNGISRFSHSNLEYRMILERQKKKAHEGIYVALG